MFEPGTYSNKERLAQGCIRVDDIRMIIFVPNPCKYSNFLHRKLEPSECHWLLADQKQKSSAISVDSRYNVVQNCDCVTSLIPLGCSEFCVTSPFIFLCSIHSFKPIYVLISITWAVLETHCLLWSACQSITHNTQNNVALQQLSTFLYSIYTIKHTA